MLRYLLLALLFLSTQSFADETKYQSYPDVWGVDFYKKYGANYDFGLLSVYDMGDGDYWFYLSRKHKKASIRQYALVKFFEKNVTELQSSKIFDENPKLAPKKSLHNFNKIYLSNGDMIKIDQVQDLDYKDFDYKCSQEFLYPTYIEKRDKDGKVLARYTVVRVLPQTFEYKEEEKLDHRCGVYDKDFKVDIQAYSLDEGTVDLKDDTFLLYDSSIIVRFDKDMKTKFDSSVNYTTKSGKKIRTSIAVIPTEVIECIRADILAKKQPLRGQLQERILDYISRNY